MGAKSQQFETTDRKEEATRNAFSGVKSEENTKVARGAPASALFSLHTERNKATRLQGGLKSEELKNVPGGVERFANGGLPTAPFVLDRRNINVKPP